MFHIRPAGARDLPFLQQWAPYSAWESLSPEEQRAADPRFVAGQVADLLRSMQNSPAESLALVAELAGQAVGFALGSIQPDATTGEPQGFLWDLFVVPPARRRGIGRLLQQSAEQLFAGAGMRKLKVYSGLHNQAGLRLAETSGFEPEGLIGLKEW